MKKVLTIIFSCALLNLSFTSSSIQAKQVQPINANEKLKKPDIEQEGTKSKKETIIWLIEDKLENINFLEKSSNELSVATYVEKQVVLQLTEFNIEIKRVSANRINKVLKTKNNFCVSNRAKVPEREEYSIFSYPHSFYVTHKLYRYDHSQPLPKSLLNSEGEIKSLKQVFDFYSHQILGVAAGVSYGKFLDEEVQKLDEVNTYMRGGSQRVMALEAMLYSKYINFLLALPTDMNPTPSQKEKLEPFTLAGAPPYLIAHFTCSKSLLGQKAINSINRILTNYYVKDEYYSLHNKWFSEQELLKLSKFLTHEYPVIPEVQHTQTN